MTRVAAVDCGTNSIRLLIHDNETGEISRRNTIVRLGQGVDETGWFAEGAIARTQAALETYVEEMQREKVSRVRMVATSATRDASNRDVFFAMSRDLLGRIEPGAGAEVISGEEEAALSFRGATADRGQERGPFCVIDLGGGSTEFVMEVEGAFHALSTQMGCVRMAERFMRSDPATELETQSARRYIRQRVSEALATVPLTSAREFIGCAGTFTTLSALVQGLEVYDAERIHMSELSFDDVRDVTAHLRSQTAEQRRANPVIHEGRADVIGSGAVIVEELMDVIEHEAGVSSFLISEKDILDGIVAGLIRNLS